jgi:protein O-GlcNAc transferase
MLPDPSCPLPKERRNARPSRLRIGYLSADYRNHPVGLIMPQVIELHDRTRVEVFGYSMGAR